MTYHQKSPLVLCILDGWGIAPDHDTNAISKAHLPTWQRWMDTCPHTTLDASGETVGLPKGQMGNSEVGHTTIGAGRCLKQDLPRITHAFEANDVETRASMQEFLEKIKDSNNTCHVMGLVSPGGIHSHQSHFEGFLELLDHHGIRTKVHAFLDGRDTPPQSGAEHMIQLKAFMESLESSTLATVMGRFYAMDRDKRWDRTSKAYDAIACGSGLQGDSVQEILDTHYNDGVFDEFIPPTVFDDYHGIEDGDALLMVNFRADRVQQILSALLLEDFENVSRETFLNFSATLGMKSYAPTLDPVMPSLFPQEFPSNTLGEVLEQNGLKQLRAAETEKYAHVTFFFNGGRDAPYDNEDRLLIPSPKVETYDLQPEMCAEDLTDQLIQKLQKEPYDLVVVNFANPDMVGHTGNMPATIRALETVDFCLETLETHIQSMGGAMLVTADHGNAECMGEKDSPHTAHTTNLVPLVFVGFEENFSLKEKGALSDIAPTLLSLMNITIPTEMTGCSLIID